MSDNKVFCDECRNDVDFTVTTKQMEGNIKGEVYRYIGKKACCADCGSEIYVTEVNDYNLRALYDVYREKNGIVSLETILSIPEKYAIGKRPLSLLLGWGEQTFSRYCDGDMPTKQYSDTLYKLSSEPRFYLELLERNKENLKTLASYEKSKRAVTLLLQSTNSIKSNIDLAIEYLLNQCQDITPLALQKALYYVQGFYYAFYQTFFFSQDCEAWVHGPVYREIYYRYRDYRFDPIEGNHNFDDKVFSTCEKAILDSVVKNICCYSGKTLENFTHSEAPWLNCRGELSENTASNSVIPKEEIAAYFNAVKEKYHMINPNDIKEYTQVMFLQM